MDLPLTRTTPVITQTFRVRPEFLSRMRLLAHDLAATSRKEKGCLLYLLSESRESPGQFLIFMIWRDTAAYVRYQASPYLRAFESHTADGILDTSISTTSWEVLG